MSQHCPQYDLNVQQEFSTFYNGMNVCTRQLFDSQGPLTKKNLTTNKELILEFAKHSPESHNPREDVTRGRSNGNGALEGLAVLNAKLETID